MPVEKSIANAVASVEMEGYIIDDEVKDWCRMLLRKEITMQEYIELAKKKIGVSKNGIQS